MKILGFGAPITTMAGACAAEARTKQIVDFLIEALKDKSLPEEERAAKQRLLRSRSKLLSEIDAIISEEMDKLFE